MDSYQEFVSSLPISETIFFVIATCLTHSITFWGYNFFFYLCYTNNWFPEYRIQKGVFPPADLIHEALIHLSVSHLIAQPLGLYFATTIFLRGGMVINSPIPPLCVIARDIIVSAVVNDLLFYFAHRLFHHRSIYKYIHKQHHRFNITIGIAAEYAHPIEDIFANLIPTLGGLLLMGSHPVTVWLWIFLRVAETVDGHSGYELR